MLYVCCIVQPITCLAGVVFIESRQTALSRTWHQSSIISWSSALPCVQAPNCVVLCGHTSTHLTNGPERRLAMHLQHSHLQHIKTAESTQGQQHSVVHVGVHCLGLSSHLNEAEGHWHCLSTQHVHCNCLLDDSWWSSTCGWHQ